MIALAATLPLSAGTASAAPEEGFEQLVLAINAAYVEALADGTIDAVNATPVLPGAPPPSTYTTNVADCLPNPEVNPYPDKPKGRFKEILAEGEIVRATIQGGPPSVGDTGSYYGPVSQAIQDAIIANIEAHYGVSLTVTDIVIPPPFFETTSVLVSKSQPRADFVDQVNALGGVTQGLSRRESRLFTCTLSASGQYLHVPAALADTITSAEDLKADPSIRICTGNLSTQLANAYFPSHAVITERFNDISACDARITAGTADIYMNSMPTLSVATSAGLVLQNTYTPVDTRIVAGTPIWVAKKGVTCRGLYDDFVPDNCTLE
jgi:hypothetical protein